jgi:polyhydroxyalkanoate synthesis regulator phasin
MPAKKRARKKVVRRRPAIRVRKAKGRLEKTWKDTQAALGSAEAAVGKRVKALVRSSGVDTRQARQTLATWRRRVDLERKKAVKQFEARLALLQARARKERRAFTRAVEDAVQRTLAALNIPSRREVHELTRRIEELSRRIDRFRR